jgi:hypothetical protein
LLIDIITLSCHTDANRSPGEGGGIGVQRAEGKEISTFKEGSISISQYSLKVNGAVDVAGSPRLMGLDDEGTFELL